MKREISSEHPAIVESIVVGDPGDISEWLQQMAQRHNLRWLLAHTDDGVIWGESRPGGLVTSHQASPDVSPALRWTTLWQARLFSTDGQLLLWPDDDGWRASLIREAQPGETPAFTESIDEPVILRGTDAQPLGDGFTRVSDGGQGLDHTVPLAFSGAFSPDKRPLRLLVRHYLDENALGVATIAASRLVNLSMVSNQKA